MDRLTEVYANNKNNDFSQKNGDGEIPPKTDLFARMKIPAAKYQRTRHCTRCRGGSKWLFTFCIISFLLLSCDAATPAVEKCAVCKYLVKSFEHGLKLTAKGNFAGGNTAWETEKLGKFATSETRLVEVMEHVCKDNSDIKDSLGLDGKILPKNYDSKCHSLLEQHEENVENWYFHKQSSNKDLTKWLCIDTVKICCPQGRWGATCQPCPGDPDRPCFGNGQCEGDGSRGGNGKCSCLKAYQGNLCRKCATGHFVVQQNDTHIKCQQCDDSCKGECKGAGPRGCNLCKDGYNMDKENGCEDIDECDEGDPCEGKANAQCENRPGSYECNCIKGYKKQGDECMVDIEAKPFVPADLWSHLTRPEGTLRSAAVLGLLLALVVIVQRRSFTLGMMFVATLLIVYFIEFGPVKEWLQDFKTEFNQNSKQSAHPNIRTKKEL